MTKKKITIMKKVKNLTNFNDYLVNEDGKIFSKKTNKEIAPATNQCGYVLYCLLDNDGKKQTVYAHRAVYEAFVGDIIEGYEVNHIDCNKKNNHYTNLNLLTHKENCNYNRDNSNNSFCKLIDEDGNVIYFESQRECSEYLNVHPTVISKIIVKNEIPKRLENIKIERITKEEYEESQFTF